MGLKNNYIVELIKNNITLFEQFDRVYLFGSVLEEDKEPNDVDILLIYRQYTNKTTKEINRVLNCLEYLLGISVDLTALSTEEEKDTQFLNRIMPHVLKLK